MFGTLDSRCVLGRQKGSRWSFVLDWTLIVLLLTLTTWGCDKKGTEPKPVANFSASPTSGKVPLSVSFYNRSSGKITSCRWSFGDGGTSSACDPVHKYASAGTYQVSLTVSGPGGSNTKSRCNYITVRRSAEFTQWWVDIDNLNDTLTMYADLEICGYRGYTFAIGGYWFRKRGDDYYYVTANCRTNVPKNYLGHQWRIGANYDRTETRVYFSVPYGCFKEKTGAYYGKIKLYSASSIPLDPNSCTLARTGYVKITWTSGSPRVAEDQPPLNVQILNDNEREDLEREMATQGAWSPNPTGSSPQPSGGEK